MRHGIPSPGWVRLVTAGLAVALLSLVPLAPAQAATMEVRGGATVLTPSSRLRSLLDVAPVDPATARGAGVSLPISRGRVSTTGLRGSISHRGALRLSRGRRTLTLRRVAIRRGSRAYLVVSAKLVRRCRRGRRRCVVRRRLSLARLRRLTVGSAAGGLQARARLNLTRRGARFVNRLAGRRVARTGSRLGSLGIAVPGVATPPRPSPTPTPPSTGGVTRTKTLRYGPFTIPESMNPGDEEMPGMLNTLRAVAKPCTDCFITRMVPNVTYADGSSANWNTDVMLHHAVLGTTARQDITCPGGARERFFASGNERTAGALPAGYGYRVGPEPATWGLLIDLMNMAGGEQTVYFDLTYTYQEASASLTPVRPIWLDIDLCGDSEYPIPAGPSDTHRDWTSPVDAKLVSLGGHVHDEGEFVEATNQSKGGASICKSVAGYGTKPAFMGHLESMTGCDAALPASIDSGDVIRLHSVYDSPQARDDVMGIMLGYAVVG